MTIRKTVAAFAARLKKVKAENPALSAAVDHAAADLKRAAVQDAMAVIKTAQSLKHLRAFNSAVKVYRDMIR